MEKPPFLSELPSVTNNGSRQNGSTVGKIGIGERALHPREQMFGWTPENESSADIL